MRPMKYIQDRQLKHLSFSFSFKYGRKASPAGYVSRKNQRTRIPTMKNSDNMQTQPEATKTSLYFDNEYFIKL